jgi:hypothetical protein
MSLPICHVPVVAETTAGPNLDNHKILKNSQTVADRRVLQADEKNHLDIGIDLDLELACRTVILFPLGDTACHLFLGILIKYDPTLTANHDQAFYRIFFLQNSKNLCKNNLISF